MISPEPETERLVPSFPTDAIYTRCYCEENVYLLAETLLARPGVTSSWEINVVFVSNETRTVALWRQKAASLPDGPVVWDYHVILILRPKQMGSHYPNAHEADKCVVFDFDTVLDLPCISRQYVEETWPYVSDPWALNPVYHSMFRIVEAGEFVENFASDRSHMVVPSNYDKIAEEITETIYAAPPPLYAPIQGASARKSGVTHNLMTEFVDMTSTKFGLVVNAQEFALLCGVPTSRRV